MTLLDYYLGVETDELARDLRTVLYDLYKPTPKEIIVNGPATIIIWDDGDKTVVKCGKNETFDLEKGIAMAVCEKLLFNGRKSQMHKLFNQMVKEYQKEHGESEH